MEENKGSSGRQQMTDEERLALAEKLDKELDEFIGGLEKRPYTEGWAEDRWQEEMDKHPFFMQKSPEPGDELHPLLEGIQQLKYDPEENTAEELASTYKEDGNFNFKYKKYRLAVWSYTEGIRQKHDNAELAAALYNNRAAAHYALHNYRSCLRDCQSALKLKPQYEKVLIRAAHCCFATAQYQACIDYCTDALRLAPTNEQVLALRRRAAEASKAQARDARKERHQHNQHKRDLDRLLDEIKSRGVQLEGGEVGLEQLEPQFPEIAKQPVHLDESGGLVWPLLVLYPEFRTMDFVQGMSEHVRLVEQLADVLGEGLVWDDCNKYKLDNVRVYFEERAAHKLHRVDVNLTLGELLRQPGYVVRGGTPSLIVLAKDSAAERHFMANYNMQ